MPLVRSSILQNISSYIRVNTIIQTTQIFRKWDEFCINFVPVNGSMPRSLLNLRVYTYVPRPAHIERGQRGSLVQAPAPGGGAKNIILLNLKIDKQERGRSL
jgi:hypothetical protein